MCGVAEGFVDNEVAKINSGVGTGTIIGETGITRNVKGEGPFHDISVRCLYYWSVAGETNGITGAAFTLTKMATHIRELRRQNHYPDRRYREI
jgi:hypothetical protein